MTSEELIKDFTGTVVIIDDGFLPAKLEAIQEEHWGELRKVSEDPRWQPIREKYFKDSGGVEKMMDLKRDEAALKRAWERYDLDPTEMAVLDPIFAHVRQSRAIDVRPLRAMVDYLETELGLRLIRHPDIASAAEDIKTCKLVFLDFYLKKGKTAKTVIEEIKVHSELFSTPVPVGDVMEGRIVYLISTSLPDQQDLEEFRQVTKIKSAFFRPVSKELLTRDFVIKELSTRVTRYGDLQKWAGFLDVFSKQIGIISESLRAEIESLELHDLAILDSVRLQVDSEMLGDYLSWLFSEALAARIRQSAPVIGAGHIVDQIGGTPFQGTLMPKQVLFGLYSDIAFDPPLGDGQLEKVHFGDVFSPVSTPAEGLAGEPPQKAGEQVPYEAVTAGEKSETNENSAEGDDSKASRIAEAPKVAELKGAAAKAVKAALKTVEELILVIAPACDLQRCLPDYEVLCVRGEVVKRVSDLADLLSPQAVYGKDQEVFKHLLRQRDAEAITYHVVQWFPKRITSIPVSLLKNQAKYSKRARLYELFGQEVKEEALRQASRVGVPVDPSFSSALSAVVSLKIDNKNYETRQAPDESFVSGIYIAATANTVIMLSEEFLRFVEQFQDELQAKGTPVNEKIAFGIAKLRETGAKGVKLTGNCLFEIPNGGGLKVRLAKQYTRGEKPQGNEIVFFPRGKYFDPPIAVKGEKALSSALEKENEASKAPAVEAAAEAIAEAEPTSAEEAKPHEGLDYGPKSEPDDKTE